MLFTPADAPVAPDLEPPPLAPLASLPAPLSVVTWLVLLEPLLTSWDAPPSGMVESIDLIGGKDIAID